MQSSSVSKQIVSALLLVLAAFVWGSTFVAQSVGSDSVEAFTFLTSRSFISGVALLGVIAIRRALRAKNKTESEKTASPRTLWIGGILCGVALMVASSLQQIGIKDTTVGKAGFVTAMYIVIVPLLGVFMKKRISANVWLGVGIAVLGMYFLCITDSFSISRGDFFVLLSALCFSVHILVIDHFSPKVDGVKLSCIQFFTCGVLSFAPALIFDKPTVADLAAAALPILYAGLLSGAVGYTLQIIAQKNLQPTVASLIMSLESVFSVLSGWVVLRQVLSVREFAGCILMFAAIVLAQLPAGIFRPQNTVLRKEKK